jgi:hypothetical protein
MKLPRSSSKVPPGNPDSWTRVTPWEDLNPQARILRVLELILVELEDPAHPLRLVDKHGTALQQAIDLIRDAGNQFAEAHDIRVR